MKLSSSYLSQLYQTKTLQEAIHTMAQGIERLKREGIQFDAIAFRGTSGVGMGFPLGYLTGVPIICVRKPSDKAHTSLLREGTSDVDVFNYLIVDDCVASGDTVRSIIEALPEIFPVGVLYYNKEYNNTSLNLLPLWSAWALQRGEYDTQFAEKRMKELSCV